MKKIVFSLLFLIITVTTALAGTYYESYNYDIGYDVPRMIKQGNYTDAFWLIDEWSYEIDEKFDTSFPTQNLDTYKQSILVRKLALLPAHTITNPDSTIEEKYNLFFNDIDGFYSELFAYSQDMKLVKKENQILLWACLSNYTKTIEKAGLFNDKRNVDMYICGLISLLKFMDNQYDADKIENLCLELSQKYLTDTDVYNKEHIINMLNILRNKRQMIKK